MATSELSGHQDGQESVKQTELPFEGGEFLSPPIMTCSECSNLLPEGVPTCPFCGAPVEDPFIGEAEKGILPPAEVNECPCAPPSQSFRASTVRDETTVGSTPGGEQPGPSLGSKMGSLGKGAWHETKRISRLLSLKAQIEKLTRVDLRRAFHELGRKAADVTTPSELELRHVRDIEAKIGSLQAEYTRTAADQSAKMMVTMMMIIEHRSPKIVVQEHVQINSTCQSSKSRVPINDAAETPSSLLCLWNPYGIVAFLPLIGPLGASFFVALNWHRLHRPAHALVACFIVPLYTTIWTSIIWFVPVKVGPLELWFSSCGIWFLVVALPQVLYFRKHLQNGYQKRRWIIPVGIAFGCSFIISEMSAFIKPSQTSPAQKIESARILKEIHESIYGPTK